MTVPNDVHEVEFDFTARDGKVTITYLDPKVARGTPSDIATMCRKYHETALKDTFRNPKIRIVDDGNTKLVIDLTRRKFFIFEERPQVSITVENDNFLITTSDPKATEMLRRHLPGFGTSRKIYPLLRSNAQGGETLIVQGSRIVMEWTARVKKGNNIHAIPSDWKSGRGQ